MTLNMLMNEHFFIPINMIMFVKFDFHYPSVKINWKLKKRRTTVQSKQKIVIGKYNYGITE